MFILTQLPVQLDYCAEIGTSSAIVPLPDFLYKVSFCLLVWWLLSVRRSLANKNNSDE